MKKAVYYLAGPMSGIPQWNFPMFDRVRDEMRAEGHEVISPADLDREIGFDPSMMEVTKEFLDEAMRRDIDAIMRVDAMVMLPRWKESTGAKAEYALARWRHIPVFRWLFGEKRLEDIPKEHPVESGPSSGLPAEWFCRPEEKNTRGGDPKKSAGDKKCPLHLLPTVALEQTAWAQKLGADRYGPFNWRETGVSFVTYHAAIMRHLFAVANGEWIDPESGQPHVAHIAASCNILMDADHKGKLQR